MLLDAKNNDRWFSSSAPASLAKSQQVPLEGDLDEHFTLYAPEGQEATAHAVFIPEVLRRVLAEVPGFDVETLDDPINFFTHKKLDPSSEETWERLSGVMFGPGAAQIGPANGPVPALRFAGGAPQAIPAERRVLKRRILTPAPNAPSGSGGSRGRRLGRRSDRCPSLRCPAVGKGPERWVRDVCGVAARHRELPILDARLPPELHRQLFPGASFTGAAG